MTWREKLPSFTRDSLKNMYDEDHKWFVPSLTKGDDPRLGYLPYQLSDFIAVLAEATAQAEGNRFIDIGCGPGVKMAVASLLFGYKCDGIEYNPDMAFRAGQIDVGDETDIWIDDALTSGINYGEYDVLWLYRPFRDASQEQQLEERIHSEMKEGAILAGGAWELKPPGEWDIVVDDWECRRGAYKKVTG
jgi:SAM-dependent methyltransferase